MSIKDLPKEVKTQIESKRDAITSIKEELNNFRDEILKIRNTLAHVTEEIGEDGISFLNSLNSDGTVIRFDNEEYIKIRKNLVKHNSNLDRIIEHLKD